jgi:membrane-associated protein TcaA
VKFCTKCGSKLEEGKTVCDNCGYDFSPKKYKFFLTKNKKIAIASTIAVVIILACFIFVGKSLSNPYKLVARFQSDISTGNKSDLSKILYSNDSRLKIDDTTNAVLVTYF